MSAPDGRAGVAIDAQRVRELILELVRCYSPSYAEGPATRVLGDAFARAGVPYRLGPVGGGHPGAAERHNLIVDLGSQPAVLLFAGHVDTITLLPGQSPEPRVEDGTLWGLGACDAKGACAAAAEAVIALHQARVPFARGLRVAFLVGEEDEGDGALALTEEGLPPLTIVGEPTGIAPCSSSHAFLEFTLRTRGERAHAALPELGANAVHAMLDWIGVLLEATGGEHELSVSLRQISGGDRAFVVAESCEARLDVHLAPALDPAAVHGMIEDARARSARRHPGCGFIVEESYWSPGFSLTDADPGVADLLAACAAAGHPESAGGFRSHSDANLLREYGTAPIVLGPGDLGVAHTSNEHLDLDELTRAAALYATLFHAVCAD